MNIWLNINPLLKEDGESLLLTSMKGNFLPSLNIQLNDDFFIFSFPDPKIPPCVLPIQEEWKKEEGGIFEIDMMNLSGDLNNLKKYFYPRIDAVKLRAELLHIQYRLLSLYSNIMKFEDSINIEEEKENLRNLIKSSELLSTGVEDISSRIKKLKGYFLSSLEEFESREDARILCSLYYMVETHLNWNRHRNYPLM